MEGIEKQQIAQKMWRDGKKTTEIVKELHCNTSWLASVLDTSSKPWLEKKHAAMREYKAEGHTMKEVAEKFGISTGTAQKICKGIAPQKSLYVPLNKGMIKSDEEMVKTIERYLPNFEYAGNYTGTDGRVDIRCKVCGTISNRSMISVRHCNVICRVCEEEKNRELSQKRTAKQIWEEEIKKAERTKREAERELEKAERALSKLLSAHACPVCGEYTTRPIYCCNDCLKRATNTRHDYKRRIKLTDATLDRDITLEALYERDNGVCWLCGEECDYADHVIRDGNFIAGNRYPSIDHIVPLSKGGRHSWDNIKLAHRICNTRKGNKEYAPASEKNE